MNNAEQFITLLDQPIEPEYRYVVEVAAGKRPSDFSRIPEAWAYVRRRIIQEIMETEGSDDLPNVTEVERLAITGHVQSTQDSPDGVAKFIAEHIARAKRRIPNVEKDPEAYLKRNSDLNAHMLNGELDMKIAQSQMFTREELEAALAALTD